MDEQEKSLDDVMAAYDQKSKDILDLKFEQSEIARKANEGLVQQRKSLDNEIFSLEQDKKSAENDLRMAEMDLKHVNIEIGQHETDLKKWQKAYDDWKEETFDETELEKIRSETFDENSTICPVCHREYPQEMKEDKVRSWEQNKNTRIAEQEKKKKDFSIRHEERYEEIRIGGVESEKHRSQVEKKAEDINKKISELKQKITSLAMEIQQKHTGLSKLPESVDLSDNAEYQKIATEIEQAEAALHEMENGSDRRREINRIKTEKTAEISKLQTLIIESEKAQDRVDELKEEQRNVSQLLADCQQELDLLRDFQKAKCDMLTDKINSMFKFVKWRLFKQNLTDDNFQEVCDPMIENEPYGRRLNHGSRALAELDICNTFQNVHDVSLPLFVDDFDGITENTMEKIIQFDRQLIFLKATEGDLKVEILD